MKHYNPKSDLLELQAEFRESLAKLAERVTYLEKLHSETEDQKDKQRGWGDWDRPNPFNNDGLSIADSLERDYSAQRRER